MLEELRNFLVEAKKATYASGDVDLKISEPDSSTTLVFEKGDWRYHDNYFGGEPYGGREVVFFQGKPVYMMVYYGRVLENASDPRSVYGILQAALRLIPADKPFRGPEKFVSEGLEYENVFQGEVEDFSGEETIKSPEGITIYRAKYAGGLVDQRR